jgi:5'-nucleotidase
MKEVEVVKAFPSRMKILITNDDGVEAPGLAALKTAASEFGEVTIVAPDREHSGCGHRVTTDEAIEVFDLGDGRFAVSGTPADCTRIALLEILPDADLVLSGINAGGNLGVDVYISGTVAAAREAVLHGVPAVAVSQYRRRATPLDWALSAEWARATLRELLEGGHLHRSRASPPPALAPLWNVNLPHLDSDRKRPPHVFCPFDASPLPLRFETLSSPAADGGRRQFSYAGDYHQRPRVPGGDVDVCLGGRIAVTALRIGR